MPKNRLLNAALTGSCICAMLVLFVWQAKVALRPRFDIRFERPELAFGYAYRNIFITGTVYTDEGRTRMGAGKIVAVAFNGGGIRGTGATTSTGYYAISGLSHSGAGVVVTAFLNNEIPDAVTATTLSGGSLHNFDLYQSRLIVRADSGAYALTNTHLNTADNTGDSDLLAIFRSNGNNVFTQSGRGLVAWQRDTYDPNGNVSVGSGVTIRGTMTPEANTVTLSGAWAKGGAATFTAGTSTVVMNGTDQSFSGSTLFYNLKKNAASAATLSFQSGSTQSMSGTLILSGAELNLLSLRIRPGETGVWKINPDGQRRIEFLDVQDSRNVNASVIDCLAGCVDSDHNVKWNFGTFHVSGVVYGDHGVTPLGAGRIVAATMNGGPRILTGVTTATGYYALRNMQYTGGSVLSLFLDNGSDDAVTTTILATKNLSGASLYKDHLIIRSDSGSHVYTNAHLATADNVNDEDFFAIVSVNAALTASVGAGKELYVNSGDTYVPGGRIHTHDLDVRGTLTLGANGLVASGSVLVSGTMTTSTGILLTSVDRETLALTGVTLRNVTFDHGVLGYWRFDDGTGATIRDSSRYGRNATLSGVLIGRTGSGWVRTSSGNTAFYNPHAMRLDGANDAVIVGDAVDADGRQDLTIAAWIRRTSSTTHDTILAKKSGTGASAAGYLFAVDTESDLLTLSIADGTDAFTLRSQTSIGAGSWYHVAAVLDRDSASVTDLYINGVADGANETGTLTAVDSLANDAVLTMGAESDLQHPFHGTLDDVRIYGRALGPSEIRALANGSRATGSGRYVLGSALNVDGNLGIYGSTLDVSAANKAVTLSGSLNAQGWLEASSATVTLDGGTQTLSGITVFYGLSKTVTSTGSLFMDPTGRQTASGSLVLRGAVGNMLRIRSTASGSLARLVLDTSGSQTLQYLSVKDSAASGGALLLCATACYDAGNNFRWRFVCGNGIKETGESCDDGGTTSGDGCSSSCAVESGYACTGTPSSCSITCGDGVVGGTEQCDEGNANANTANASCRTDCTSRRCGDGIIDSGEACDDGNTVQTDACLNTCALAICGDTFVRTGVEECEPPGTAVCQENCFYRAGGGGGGTGGEQIRSRDRSSSSSSFSARSAPPGCGNAILEAARGEECDNGRFNGLSDCSYDCKEQYCGDGRVSVEIGEECEPIPMAGPNGEKQFVVGTCGEICSAPDAEGLGGCRTQFLPECPASSASSAPPRSASFAAASVAPSPASASSAAAEPASPCGNSVKDPGEECDDGNALGGDGCTALCTLEASILLVCGDGIAVGEEECDDGNNASGDGCSSYCEREDLLPACGDGRRDDGEQCDAGAANSDTAPNACRLNCRRASCGDFIVDDGEECDQGERNSPFISDRCRPDCRAARCGDGVRDAGEECDGNLWCTPSCRLSMRILLCGNGTLNANEECDDANTRDGDGCSSACRAERSVAGDGLCGNGIRDAGEECDDGNGEERDGCSSVCRLVPRLLPRIILREFKPAASPPPAPPPAPAPTGNVLPWTAIAGEQDGSPVAETGPRMAALLVMTLSAFGCAAWMRRKRGRAR